MSEQQILIAGGRVIDPARSVDGRLDVVIENERRSNFFNVFLN